MDLLGLSIIISSIIIIVPIIILLSIAKYNQFKTEQIMNEHQFRILDASMQVNLEEVISLFDGFIDIVMQEHMQLNFDYKDISYINTELEEELLRNISNKVMDRISPFIVTKLSLIYRIESDDDLAELITTRTYLKLLKYITQLNSIKENIQKTTPNISLITKNK